MCFPNKMINRYEIYPVCIINLPHPPQSDFPLSFLDRPPFEPLRSPFLLMSPMTCTLTWGVVFSAFGLPVAGFFFSFQVLVFGFEPQKTTF